jgi:HD-like signal output (HDOD) protein
VAQEERAARPVVLVIDGERFVRESVQKVLGSGVEAVAVATPDDGLKVLSERAVDLVLADYRMGGTDGVQFLRKVRAKHPRATRLLMSGFLDQSTFTRFLSSGLVSAFIAKPWQEARLREKVEHILAVRGILGGRELLDAVNALQGLPTLPALFHDLVIAVEDQKPMKEIATMISHDSAVAARLLHVSNSAFFGFREVTTIEGAVVLLGASLLKDLVLTTELLEGGAWTDRQRQETERIFHHSFAVNRVLPVVYRLVYRRLLDPAFTSVGLMHDVGKLLMLRSFPERYEAITSARAPGQLDGFWRAEIDAGLEGATHAEIGGWLLDFWNFPQIMIEAALFHHQPHRTHQDAGHVLVVTALANRLVHVAEGGEMPGAEAVPDLGVPGLPPETVGRMVRIVRDELESVRKRSRS